MTHIDFRVLDIVQPTDIQQPSDELIAYIAAHLPNAKSAAEKQKQLDDNEHEIRRFIES